MPAADRLDEPFLPHPFSRTVTLRPRRASLNAISAPVTPAPMMTTLSLPERGPIVLCALADRLGSVVCNGRAAAAFVTPLLVCAKDFIRLH